MIVIERDSQTDRKKRERGTKRQNTEYKYTKFFFNLETSLRGWQTETMLARLDDPQLLENISLVLLPYRVFGKYFPFPLLE